MVVKLPGEAQWLPIVNEWPMTATRAGPAARRRLTTARTFGAVDSSAATTDAFRAPRCFSPQFQTLRPASRQAFASVANGAAQVSGASVAPNDASDASSPG